jgi:hypothetical protein
MNRELATRALDEAFVDHVRGLFKDYAENFHEGDDGQRDAFLDNFHRAKHAYDDAATHMEMTDAHATGGLEDDNAYRMRLGAFHGLRASRSRFDLSRMTREELDSYGVQIGIPRGYAEWNPPAPVVEESAA